LRASILAAGAVATLKETATFAALLSGQHDALDGARIAANAASAGGGRGRGGAGVVAANAVVSTVNAPTLATTGGGQNHAFNRAGGGANAARPREGSGVGADIGAANSVVAAERTFSATAGFCGCDDARHTVGAADAAGTRRCGLGASSCRAG